MSKTRIIEAVKRLDVDSVKQLLNEKPPLIGSAERDGRNLLHLACCASCEKLGLREGAAARMAALLLDRGLEIDTAVGRDRCTALFYAVARGRNPTLLRFLLKRGANPAVAPGGGLFAAAWWDDVKSLDLLLRAGAEIDVVVGVTPFLAAWCWQRFEAAKFLARRGADVNYRDPKGRTALHHGVEREFDPALLKWLVQHGGSPDVEDGDGVPARARASRKRDKRFAAAMA